MRSLPTVFALLLIASTARAGKPVCGDGLVGGFEECDGASDAACPGQCSDRCACPALAASGNLEIHVIDVGQGDGIAVLSPDGFVMLVDAGTEGNAAAIEAYLAGLGVTGIDYTLVSHLHTDHFGAMDVLIDGHPEIVASFDNGGTTATTEYAEYDASAGARRTTVTPGETIDMGPAITVDVLHAQAGSSNENDNSVVIRITHGGRTFLLGGDCEAACEASFDPGPIDLYKVHHHGSDSSSTEPFLDLMAPYTAVISVGTGNSYGHPDQSTLDALSARNVDVHRTDLEGTIAVVSDGVAYTVDGQPVCQSGQTLQCGTTDVGACQYGQRDCVSGFWGACAGAIDPVPEDCSNGIDDDCNGMVDECSGGVVIAQVAYDTPGDDAVEEFVDLYNPTAGDIDVSGWTLEDNTGSWALPAATVVPAGAYLSVARDTAGFAALHGKDPDVSGMTIALNNGGDQVRLVSGTTEVDYVAWESFDPAWPITAAIGNSIERTDPTVDTDSVSDWSVTSPATPRGGTTSGGGPSCGDATCDPGEDCDSCPADCIGQTSGPPSGRYCCGNGTCEPAGEDATTCAVDC